MNSNGKHNRRPPRDPHYIEYWRGDRMLRDTGDGFEAAKRRIELRLSKRHNKGERAIVYKNRVVVFDTHPGQPVPR